MNSPQWHLRTLSKSPSVLEFVCSFDCTCACTVQKLGLKKALVVHSSGLDELTPMAPADIVEVTAGSTQLKCYSLDPKDLGIPRCEVCVLACVCVYVYLCVC